MGTGNTICLIGTFPTQLCSEVASLLALEESRSVAHAVTTSSAIPILLETAARARARPNFGDGRPSNASVTNG